MKLHFLLLTHGNLIAIINNNYSDYVKIRLFKEPILHEDYSPTITYNRYQKHELRIDESRYTVSHFKLTPQKIS